MPTRWTIPTSTSMRAFAPPSPSSRLSVPAGSRRSKGLVLRPVTIERQFLLGHQERLLGGLRGGDGLLGRGSGRLAGDADGKGENENGTQGDQAFHGEGPSFCNGGHRGGTCLRPGSISGGAGDFRGKRSTTR